MYSVLYVNDMCNTCTLRMSYICISGVLYVYYFKSKLMSIQVKISVIKLIVIFILFLHLKLDQ